MLVVSHPLKLFTASYGTKMFETPFTTVVGSTFGAGESSHHSSIPFV
jgi:hypothetical protein